MITLTAAVWYLAMPIWGVMETDDWYEQKFSIITEEPGLEDIEMKLRQRELQERFRILENMGAPNEHNR